MQIFNDQELNQRANTLKNLIEGIADPIGAVGAALVGYQVNLFNPDVVEKKMQEIHENGLLVAKDLLNNALPDLNYIKSRTGNRNETYLEFSDALALTASAVIKIPVSFVNSLTRANDFHSNQSLVNQTKFDLAEATRLMGIVSNLDMSPNARLAINQVINMINGAEKAVNAKAGCYIATCVYGNYNTSEVMILRSFRDNILSKHFFGRIFIHCYYNLSPKFVKTLGNVPVFNKVFKIILDNIISKIK